MGTRRTTTAPYRSIGTIATFAMAAPVAEIKISLRRSIRSAIPSTADATAPTTNPSCSTTTSNDDALVDKSQRVRSSGRTAEVLNHVVIASMSPKAMTVSAWRC